MKFSKDLLGSSFLHVYKVSAFYHALFHPLKRVTCPSQKFFLGFLLTKMSRHFPSKRQRVYRSCILQMKANDKEKRLLGVLTLDDIGVTQGQGQTCQIFTI